MLISVLLVSDEEEHPGVASRRHVSALPGRPLPHNKLTFDEESLENMKETAASWVLVNLLRAVPRDQTLIFLRAIASPAEQHGSFRSVPQKETAETLQTAELGSVAESKTKRSSTRVWCLRPSPAGHMILTARRTVAKFNYSWNNVT
jgi:hypothetical protein